MSTKPRTRPYFKGFRDFLGPYGAARLSPAAQALLLALLVQYNGLNNGSFKITASTLPARWRWNTFRQRTRDELVNEHFIFLVAKGRKPNIASLYAIACFPLDHNPQHDPDLAAKFDPDSWRQSDAIVDPHGGIAPEDQEHNCYPSERVNGDFADPHGGIASPAIDPHRGITAEKRYPLRDTPSYFSTRSTAADESGEVLPARRLH